MSRASHPKQFLALTSKQTMLQDTINRLGSTCQDPIIICNEEHRFIVAEQLRSNSTKASEIILEPVGRNTAPAIALAALSATKNGSDPYLLVLAADHVIEDVSRFQQAVDNAKVFAEEGKLVAFGIVPRHPETGYGYIKQGGKQQIVDAIGFEVDAFVEKPNYETAEKFVDSGDYLWNSGMFLFKASKYLVELEQHSPKIYKVCKDAFDNKTQDYDFTRIDGSIFSACPDDSIDYAVMEHTQSSIVVPLDAGWSDVGSFSSLWEVKDKDENANVVQGDVILEDTSNSFVYSSDRLVTTVGIDNLVVVETKDAVLVALKDKVQDVKQIVTKLKAMQRNEFKDHREVYRPWGKYDSLDTGLRDQVKRITVNPGAKLSVQMHHHRSEHWVVVSGTAKVTNGEKTYLITENQSTYIPLGQIHALENPGILPLELIEVQTGAYLGEDDIVRFQDKYGRD
ncbi:MAG: mannose-1-phosphate guanylyltransferase [Osedax symbiont Rs2]|nr:MAG: mannose-1-phosphate guanylyltransferase [Osedax symbiont Rs2]